MRTFFCLELPEDVKDKINGIRKDIKGPAYVKWVSQENLHITLKFLGEVEENQVSTIKERTEGAAVRSSPFGVDLDRLGGFPHLGFPKVIWLGSNSPPDDIYRLHEDLEESLFGLGFEKEDRDYVPHVTLGRTKEDEDSRIERLGENLKNLDFDSSWRVPIGRLTMMKSELRSDGPVYTPLFRVELGN
ncbi:MAG: RNA 2',3'-cyclic phosphodiesterase [Candidatus Bipolaricaulota bacterium]